MRDGGRIAFIGLGLMGAPMAARLIDAGYGLALWNRSPDKAKAITGGDICATPAEAVAGAEVICLCLTDAKAVEDLLFGAGGLAAALSPRQTVIDFSTIGVAAAKSFAAGVAATWLDCPVSGGVAGAKAGTLAILAGGDAQAIDRVRPILAHLSARVTRMGDAGAGQAAKLCNQLIVTCNLMAVAEAMALGEALGVDIAQLPPALAGGFADSIPLQIFGPRMAPPSDPGPRVASTATMFKDIAAIQAAAGDAGARTPLMTLVEARYRRLIDAGLGGEDLPVLMRLYRDGALDAR